MGVSRSGGLGFRVFWLWGVGFQVQGLGRVCEWGGGGGGFKAFPRDEDRVPSSAVVRVWQSES